MKRSSSVPKHHRTRMSKVTGKDMNNILFSVLTKLNKPVLDEFIIRMHVHNLTSHFFMNHFFSLISCYIQLVTCFFFLVFISYTSVLQVAIAQQQSSLDSSENMIKALLAETNETLKSGNTTRTIENLLTIQRLIVRDNDNSSSTQDLMLLIRETVGAIVNGRSDVATANLNLINKQLITQPPDNVTSKAVTSPPEKTIPSIQPAVPSNETSKAVTSPPEKTIPSIQPAVPSNETSKAVTSPPEKTIPSIQPAVPSNETSKAVTSPPEKTIPSIQPAVPSNETSKAVTSPPEKTIPSIQPAVPSNETSKAVTSPPEKTIPSIQPAVPSNETSKAVDNGTTIGFQTYQNRIFGIKILYPDSWSVRSYPYNNAGNNTVVGFYSPSKTASQLGNISGVSGHFVPYIDIFVFDSKNMSLDKIIKGRINRIQNTSDFVLESKPFALNGNRSAHMLVYSTIAGGDEFFKKMQVYTVFGNKVYLITFTAQEALFSNNLPTVQKMIDSFEI